MKKTRSLGLYVGACVDPTFDWNAALTKIAAAGYNSISVFLTTAFYNTGLWPWPLANGKFNFGALNLDYWEHFRKACLASAETGVRLHLCFVDQFHSKDDSPGPDPFRDGLGTDDEETWYSAITMAPVKYWWLQWDPNKDPKEYDDPAKTLAQYKTIGAFGAGMDRFTTMIVSVCATVKKNHPAFPEPTWKWGNETFARMRDGKKVASRGDRDEVVIWMKAKWKKAGFPNNMYFDFLAFSDGIGRDHVDYAIMHEAFTKGIRGKHKSRLEVHGILNVADTQKFGFSPAEQQFVKWSTDGDLKMIGDYPGLGKSNLPDVDLKMDARIVTARNVNDFFNNLMPKYTKYVV